MSSQPPKSPPEVNEAAHRPQRRERDTMGELSVPHTALWGAGTQRAVDNFPLGGPRFPRRFIHALGLVKGAAAETNADLGLIPREIADAIAAAAREVGGWEPRRPLRARHLPDRKRNLDEHERQRGHRQPRDPDAGRRTRLEAPGPSQRSREPRPVVQRRDPDRAAHRRPHRDPRRAAAGAAHPARGVAREEQRVPTTSSRSGRTHLQDATPIRLGQEFEGYARQIERSIARAEDALADTLGGRARRNCGRDRHQLAIPSSPGVRRSG